MPRPEGRVPASDAALSHPVPNSASSLLGLPTPFILGLTKPASKDGLGPGTEPGLQAPAACLVTCIRVTLAPPCHSTCDHPGSGLALPFSLHRTGYWWRPQTPIHQEAHLGHFPDPSSPR